MKLKEADEPLVAAIKEQVLRELRAQNRAPSLIERAAQVCKEQGAWYRPDPHTEFIPPSKPKKERLPRGEIYDIFGKRG